MMHFGNSDKLNAFSATLHGVQHWFLRATAVPAGTAEARISYGDSVRLSVRLSRPGAETTE